jgi:hypothetical protein
MAISHVKSNTIADWTGTVTVGNSTGGTETVAASNLVRPSDWNSAHNQFYTLSGNTTNASTASGTNVVFQGAGGVTLSGNGDTIVFSARSHEVLSYFANLPFIPAGTTNGPFASNSTVYVQPFLLPQDGSFEYFRMFGRATHTYQVTFGTATNSVSSLAGWSGTIYANIYTQGTGASAVSLQYYTQMSTSVAVQVSYSATSISQFGTWRYTYPDRFGSSGTTSYTTSTATATSFTVSPAAGPNSFAGNAKVLDIPMNFSLSAGNYWIGYQASTTSSVSNLSFGFDAVVQTNNSTNWIPFGPTAATNSTQLIAPFFGRWTTNTLGRTTSSMAQSNMTTNVSNVMAYFQMLSGVR